ncbi:MAG: MarR family transcriptional regulator [Acidimicrobiaceae bacterium]
MSERRIRAHEVEDIAAARIGELGLDPLTFRAMFGIFRLGGRMFNDLESTIHKPAGWSLAGFRVMFLLWVGGPMESHEIARLAGLSRAAISSAVNTLERDGLVDRRRESDDRRVVTVYLTDDGAERLEAAYLAQGSPDPAGVRRARTVRHRDLPDQPNPDPHGRRGPRRRPVRTGRQPRAVGRHRSSVGDRAIRL